MHSDLVGAVGCMPLGLIWIKEYLNHMEVLIYTFICFFMYYVTK